MKIAKQFTAFLLVVALCAAFSGCSGTPAVSDEPAKANRFPLELKTVNGIMENNGISLMARDVQEQEPVEGVTQTVYILYSLDEESNESFGLAYSNRGEKGAGVGLALYPEKIGKTDADSEKLIKAALDLYGEFSDKQAIVDNVLKAAEKGDVRVYEGDGYNARTFYYLKAGGVNLTFDFVERDGGYAVRRVEIMDDDMFSLSLENNSDYAWAQDLQKELKK